MIEREENRQFELVSKYRPTGDQPTAIKQLVDGIQKGEKNRFFWVRPELERLLPFQT